MAALFVARAVMTPARRPSTLKVASSHAWCCVVAVAWSMRCAAPIAGRLFQVEYALQAINNAAAAVGVLSSQGVIIAAEKKIASSLLAPPKASEKMYKLDDHVCCAVAGLTSDANTLIRHARVYAQQYKYKYSEEIPVEQLVVQMCDYKQSYTQHGGLRPFGVSFLYAGWDHHRGFQLYVGDPSGNYSGWKATAIGQNYQVTGLCWFTHLRWSSRHCSGVTSARGHSCIVLHRHHVLPPRRPCVARALCALSVCPFELLALHRVWSCDFPTSCT